MEIKDQLRHDQGELLRALQSAGANIEKPKAMRCPFHDDAHPSAGIYQREDGVWAFKCHVCGINLDVFDVQAKVKGIPVEEILRSMSVPRSTPIAPPTHYATIQAMESAVRGHEATYCYGFPAVSLVVLRSMVDGRKRFLQARPVPGGGYVMEAPARPHPLYNLGRVMKADTVIVVEGEKCVRALHELGIVATTSPGGAKNARGADWSPLAGKRLYLWPDNDDPGRAYIADVKNAVEKLPGVVLHPIDIDALALPAGGDVVDLLEENGGTLADKRTAIELILSKAKPTDAADDVVRWIEDVAAGRISCIDWPFQNLSRLAKALYPGSIVVVPGVPGSGKSLFMLESFWHWHEKGIKVALLELEKDRRFHLVRVMAQMAEQSGLSSDEWIREHPDEALGLADNFRGRVDQFARCVWDDTEHQKTPDDLAAWVERRCEEGARIIGIDPVTAARYERRDTWNEDQAFLLRAGKAITAKGAALILITHPRSAGPSMDSSMDNMAGGRAYSRFSDVILFIEHHHPAKSVNVMMSGGRYEMEITRSIQIRKCRNGVGAGTQIGYNLEANSLRFAEQGVVIQKEK